MNVDAEENANSMELINNFDLNNAIAALSSNSIIRRPPDKTRKMNGNKKEPTKGDEWV